MNRKLLKTLLTAGLAIILTCAMMLPAFAATASAGDFKHIADELNSMGLLQGRDGDYALGSEPNRAEALVMLIRLLGVEREAEVCEDAHPFTDTGWAEPYIAYAFNNRLTQGTSETEFSPQLICTAQMYVTFVLRALGYDDRAGDFTYDGAIAFGKEIGIVDDNLAEGRFLRGDMVAVSYLALKTAPKDGSYDTLLEKLIAEGAVTAVSAAPILVKFILYNEFVRINSSLENEDNIEMSMAMNVDMGLASLDAFYKISMITDGADVRLAMFMDMKFMILGEALDTHMEMYMLDEYVYVIEGEARYKIPADSADIDIDSLISMTALGETPSDPIYLYSGIAKSEVQGFDEYTIVYIGDYLDLAIGDMIGDMGAGGSNTLTEPMIAKIYAKDGVLQWMSMSLSIDGMPVNVEMRIIATGSDVAITFPDDLDEFELLTLDDPGV